MYEIKQEDLTYVLTEDQYLKLKVIADEKGLSVAEYIYYIIENFTFILEPENYNNLQLLAAAQGVSIPIFLYSLLQNLIHDDS